MAYPPDPGQGSTSLAASIKTVSAATYSFFPTDATILADATAAPQTLTLMAAAVAVGKIFTVKKIDATANMVAIATQAGETIDGSASLGIVNRYSSFTIQANGASWDIVASV
jgi:hypothetical protein